MSTLLRRAVDQGLALNERLGATANNAFDWLFLRGMLVQSGLTPFEPLIEGDPMSLRYYAPPASGELLLAGGERLRVRPQRQPVPLLLVPPLGVTVDTFDLLPRRSLVRYMAARGFHTYLVDWGRPERRHAGLELRDYSIDMLGRAIEEVRRHAGVKPVSLMGWCMGGLMCLLHAAATRDRSIRNLITVASPIDLHRSGMLGRAARATNTPARLIRRFSSFRLQGLDPARLHIPGWATTLGFKLTDPVGSLTGYWDLVTRLWDREFVETHATTSDYLNHMLSYPGGVFRDVLNQLMVDNRLATGSIDLGNGIVADLAAIKSNLLSYAGLGDHLVPPPVARKSVKLVASRDKEFRTAPGGHMGVILGSRARAAVWEPCAQWLESRSAVNRPSSQPSAAEETLRQVRTRRLAEDVTL